MLTFFILFIYFNFCNGYNVDTLNIERFSGNSDSMFGYSSALHINNEGSWIIVGAPRDNMTTANFLRNPGNIYKCRLFQAEQSCEAFSIRTPEDTRPNGNGAYEEDNQFLGGSIVRTKTKVTACAQLWKNLDDTYNLEKPVGRCHDISHDLQQVETNKQITYPSYYSGGYSFSMSLIGTVAMPTDVDDQIILGAPGMYNHKGGFVMYDATKTTGFYDTYTARLDNSLYTALLDDANMAYAVDVGELGPSSACASTPVAAGIPHFANENGHLGSFIVLCATGGDAMTVLKQYTGDQIGSGYGMAVCVADVNSDGIKDVLVGAPLQSVGDIDEGTVFVYYGTRDANYFEGVVQNIYGKKEAGGRFGNSIVKLGDINKDNIDDIAIGAPYEDDGAGAVYIFNGNSAQLNAMYSQRIAAKTLFPGITSFGTYISLPLDVDQNHYADFAVGAYNSDTTFIMLTRPVVDMTARLVVSPSLVPLTSTLLPCASEQNENPCVTLTLCFSYNGTAVPSSINVTYTLNGDSKLTNAGKSSRVDLYKDTTNYKGTVTSKPINVTIDGETCETVYARVISTSRAFFDELETSLDFTASFKLSESSTEGNIRPILNNNYTTTVQEGVTFQTGCVGVCQPDLQVTITKETSTILYGETSEFSVLVGVVNKGDAAFGVRTTIDVDTNNARFLSFTTLLDKGSVPVKCSEGLNENNKTVLHCDHDNALFQQQLGSFRIRYNVSSAALSNGNRNYSELLTYVNVNVVTSAAGIEKTTGDNTDSVRQDITFSANIEIAGISSPEQARVSAGKDKVLTFSHAYSVFNKGPSPLFAGKIYYLIPAITDKAVIMVPANTYQVKSKDAKSNCSVVLVPGVYNGQTMNNLPAISDDGGYVPRRVECAGETDAKCIVIECLVNVLESQTQASMDVTFGVSEASINLDTTPELQFYTRATIYPVPTVPDVLKANTTATAVSFIYPQNLSSQEQAVNLWIIIGSSIGGVVMFIVLGVILWKCGFFKRDKKDQIEKWKRQSRFHEKTMTERLSRLNPAGPKDDTIALNT